jgi:putative solute:sodium symporter small subunit
LPWPRHGSKWEVIVLDPKSAQADAYWQANLRIIKFSLVIWALVSFGFGIILRPLLSGIPVGGTDLGFWFAQQGSILVFLGLIFFYAWRMNKLDREFDVDEQ